MPHGAYKILDMATQKYSYDEIILKFHRHCKKNVWYSD